MILSEPSLLPCSFPTQGYLMVQMAAGAPAFLPAFQEGRRGKGRTANWVSLLWRYFLKSFQPFAIKHDPGLVPNYKEDLKTCRHCVKLNKITSPWLRKKRRMYRLDLSGTVHVSTDCWLETTRMGQSGLHLAVWGVMVLRILHSSGPHWVSSPFLPKTLSVLTCHMFKGL